MKKEIKKRNIIIIMLIFIIVSIYTFYFIKMSTPFISTIEILGQTFKLKPGIYVYEFDMSNYKINEDDSDAGCVPEYEYTISKLYENSYDNVSGIKFFVEGQTYADFRLKFTKNDRTVEYYYFLLNFTQPLEVDEGC
jgi:hypothetical protein